MGLELVFCGASYPAISPRSSEAFFYFIFVFFTASKKTTINVAIKTAPE